MERETVKKKRPDDELNVLKIGPGPKDYVVRRGMNYLDFDIRIMKIKVFYKFDIGGIPKSLLRAKAELDRCF